MVFTGSFFQSGSTIVTGSVSATSFTGSLLGTASFANNATSASYALSSSFASTASFVQNAVSASFASTASYVLNAISSSFAATASSADNFTVRGTLTAQTIVAQTITASTEVVTGSTKFGSIISNTHQFTGSVSISGSLAINGVDYNTTSASFDTRILSNSSSIATLSSSYLASSASFATNISNNSASIATLSSSFLAFSASYNTGSFTGSFTGTLTGTASWANNATTSSYALNATSASFAITASTAQDARNILVYVKNSSGAQIDKGKVVRIVGAIGDNPLIATASYTDDNNSANTLGVTNETIANDAFGYVITEGTLLGIDTSAYTAGQLIYLGATGSITGSAPVAPLHAVRLGEVLRVQLNNGSIYVRVDNGYELGELHDVRDTTTTGSYGDLLVKSGSIWINSKQLTGSYGLTGSLTSTNGGFTGSLQGTASWANNAISASYASNADLLDGKDSSTFATTGSNIFRGTQTVTGSLFTSGSNTLVGSTILSGSVDISGSTTITGTTVFRNSSTTITGSLLISGSTTQVGNNNLLGNTTLSGSIIISGSTTTPTVQVYGNITHDGYVRFNPVSTNIDQSISASYIYGNLYTGLLNGGLITITTGSTWFNLSSGSGIIVDLNASLNDNPYPTVTYVNWGNFVSQSLTYLTSSIQSYIGIDENGQITQQTTPYVNGEYNTKILIGTVLHQNQTTVNASITYPNVAYGYKQRTYDFIKAFGPLKLSGYTINPSSSLGLTISGGTAWADGRNYQTDPNNPSYITDPGTTVSKIFRYYQSGSVFVQDTNGGLGYTVLDPANYNNNGTLTAVSPATPYTIQRVFWYPNSATKGIVVYYGNAQYSSISTAEANINYETFNEVENTKQNAIYLGAIIIKYNGVFTNPTDYVILPGGIFRSVGGTGGGGSVVTTRLVDLSDVAISGPTDGQALVYNSSTLKWENESYISASISGNALTATSASYASTASFVQNAVSASFASTASFVQNAVSASFASTASFVQNAQSASFATRAITASYADNFTVAGTLTAQTIVVQTITASTEVVTGSTKFGTLSSNTHQFTGSVSISGSLNVNGPATLNNLTGSLFGTSSFANNATTASNALTASYVLNAISASFATSASYWSGSILNATSASFASTASFVQNAQSASYVLNAVSASFASTSSYVLNAVSSSFASNAALLNNTGSSVFATTGSNIFRASQTIEEVDLM